jgi:tRNA(Ile)-lysidine synthase TilS/MesJ
MENNFDCLLLASGGMDSTVLAYKLAKENKNVVILLITVNTVRIRNIKHFYKYFLKNM